MCPCRHKQFRLEIYYLLFNMLILHVKVALNFYSLSVAKFKIYYLELL